MALLWEQLKRVGKPNTAFIFFCTTKFGYELIKSNEKWFRYDLVWNKPGTRCGFLLARKMPMRCHEMIYVFYNKLPTYNIEDNHTKIQEIKYDGPASNCTLYSTNKITTTTKPVWEPRLPGSIIDCPVDSKRQHPTEKPQGILEWLIKYYSKAGDTVLDPTMGCGSCGLACRSLGRSFVGIEMNEDFFNKAMQRLAV
jgi:DNA modification methylase